MFKDIQVNNVAEEQIIITDTEFTFVVNSLQYSDIISSFIYQYKDKQLDVVYNLFLLYKKLYSYYLISIEEFKWYVGKYGHKQYLSQLDKCLLLD